MTHSISWLRLLATLLAWGCLAAGATPVVLEGQRFDTQLRLAGSELQLNGVGLRARAWVKGYAAGLYLPRRADSAVQALAMKGPKRLQMRMLLDVPAEEFVKAIEKGIARNTESTELPQLHDRVRRFAHQVAALGKVRKGDVVDLDYLPTAGLVLAVNGRARGEAIPGEDLYAAVLRIFVGDKPVDAALKAGLLGARAS